jgi:hypothetical protein
VANNRWATDDGQRWQSAEHTRIGRRFRGHVRTETNPKGRIHREPCYFHREMIGEAHHPDYDQPWAVVWLCSSCHRRADHGTLRVTKKMIWDYTSLVPKKPKLYRNGLVVVKRSVGANAPF